MSNTSDFIIENGVLKKYVGPGGDVVVPKEVTEIGDSAFAGISKLKTVIIPGSVKKIGRLAFRKCVALARIDMLPGLQIMSAYAFYGCKKLKRISIPETLTVIEGSAFADCKELEEISLPSGLQTIGATAFANCKSLKRIDIPNSVQMLSDEHVVGCSSLEYCHIPGFDFSCYKASQKPALATAVLAAFDQYTDEDKFRLLPYLKKQCNTVVSHMIMVGNEAAMVSVLKAGLLDIKTIDAYINLAAVEEKHQMLAILLNYKNQTFSQIEIEKERHRKENAILNLNPLSVTELKKIWTYEKTADGTLMIKTYKGNDHDVVIPAMIGKSKVSALRFDIFSGSQTLISVVVPEGINRIGSAFYDCAKLEKVYLPNTVTEIGKYSFTKCPLLTIHTPVGSYAETYAKENNISFVAE